jgi:hypothetical protein
MGVVGGDIREITCNHDDPAIGTRIFRVKQGADTSFDPGGIRTDDDKAGVDGGGRMVKKMTRGRWSLKTTLTWDMNTVNELEVLRLIAAAIADGDVTVEHVNGTVWAGKGTVVGEVEGNGQSGEIPIVFQGGGIMRKIVG